jgi:hypothetical protein
MKKIMADDIAIGRAKAGHEEQKSNNRSYDGHSFLAKEGPICVFKTGRERLKHWIKNALRWLRSFCYEKESLQGQLIHGIFYHRRFPRIKCHHLAKCYYINDEQRNWVTNLKDISEGGLKLWTPEKIQSTDLVNFIIYFAHHEHQVEVVSKMVWTRPVGYDGQGYVAGFTFVNPHPFQQDFLRHYVQAHLN